MPERKACPDCGSPLGPRAVKCRCGWQATSAPTEAHASRQDLHGRYFNACEAYGCPLAGTISNTPGPGGSWWCFVHHAHKDGDLQEVTRLIRLNRETYAAYPRAIMDGDRKSQAIAAHAMIEACNPSGLVVSREPGEDDERVAA